MAIKVISHSTSAIIHKNLADEHTAIQGYEEMLETITDKEDIAVIEEIISEELKHIELLTKMAKKYSDIKAE